MALIGAWLGNLIIFMFSSHILKIIGQKGLIALEKLMGLLLVMLAVQLLLTGVIEFIAGMAMNKL